MTGYLKHDTPLKNQTKPCLESTVGNGAKRDLFDFDSVTKAEEFNMCGSCATLMGVSVADGISDGISDGQLLRNAERRFYL